jgi:hypothetical protein
MFNSVKSGDTVVLDVTVYDTAGKPIITSEQTVFNQAVGKGQEIFEGKFFLGHILLLLYRF